MPIRHVGLASIEKDGNAIARYSSIVVQEAATEPITESLKLNAKMLLVICMWKMNNAI
jgi:hypothetical protein